MQTNDGFNDVTVDWQRTNFSIDSADPASFDAKPADIETFQRDGVVLLKGACADWVDKLRAGFQRNLDNPQQFAFPCDSNPEGRPGQFFDSYCNWQLIPEYLDYIGHSSAASMACQFMESNIAQFFHEHAFIKTPGTRCATPWHQDLPYYCVDGLKTVSVYVSLDQADADVAVKFVKGSHRWNKLFYPRVFKDGSNFNTDQANANLEAVPDIDANLAEYDIAAWSLEPGDTILFDFRTLHGTGDAEIKSTRRAFSSRWLGDDVTYCERPGETSPPYTGHDMAHGDKMREDWFPVLWRR
jgi:ectoine hydroxylase-related dioxygenase (phytanoyl-CoA dioxygenase family)